ncbi:MAG: hypothetical protein RIR95_1675 [Pseudomonadota bacterium]
MDYQATSTDAIIATALEWHRSGRGAVLATVIETWGSSPRQAGSQLAVSGQGHIIGSVSAGCVEAAVIGEALEAFAAQTPRICSYGVSDETAFAAGLACGGNIRILVEPVAFAQNEAHLGALVRAQVDKRPMASSVNLQTFASQLWAHGEDPAIDAVLRNDRAVVDDSNCFIMPHNPALRLVIVGAVHIAQPLAAMARMVNFDPVIVDPRETFATTERFAGHVIVTDWPDAALSALKPDARTAVVLLSHDPKLDDPALHIALQSQAFYIGALGSKKTNAKRVERLVASGVSDAQIARIHAPVGAAIGAKSPAEIAISILAQMIQVLRAAP